MLQTSSNKTVVLETTPPPKMDHVSKSVELYHQFLNEMESGDYTSDVISFSQEPDLLLGDNESIVRIELVPDLETCRKDLLDGKRTPSPDSNTYSNSLRKRQSRYHRPPNTSSTPHKNYPQSPQPHSIHFSPHTESTSGSCIYDPYLESDLDEEITDDDDDTKKGAAWFNPVVPGLFPSMDIRDTNQFASPEILPLVPSYSVDDPAAYI